MSSKKKNNKKTTNQNNENDSNLLTKSNAPIQEFSTASVPPFSPSNIVPKFSFIEVANSLKQETNINIKRTKSREKKNKFMPNITEKRERKTSFPPQNEIKEDEKLQKIEEKKTLITESKFFK